MVLLAAAACASSALAAARAPDVARAQPQRADSLAVVAIVSNLRAALVRGDSTLVISMLARCVHHSGRIVAQSGSIRRWTGRYRADGRNLI
jgi:hypothetical protein